MISEETGMYTTEDTKTQKSTKCAPRAHFMDVAASLVGGRSGTKG